MKRLVGVNPIEENFDSRMKGDEEETVSRRREEEVCKISVDDTYEGVSVLLSLQCQCININIDIDELISVDDTYEGVS